MKKLKSALIALLVLVIIGGSIGGGLYAYMRHQNNSLSAEVFSVSELNMGYDSSDTSSTGYITNKSSQSIELEDTGVSEVYVAAGDTVAVGDALLKYDTRSIDLDIEMKQLSIQTIKNNIILAQRDLDQLNKTTPVEETTEEDTEEDTETETESPFEPPQEKENEAYNFISETAIPYAGDGSVATPFRFLCTQDAYVQGSYINDLIKNQKVAAFEIYSDNDLSNGKLLALWTVDGTQAVEVSDDSRFLVQTQEDMVVLEAEQRAIEAAERAAEKAKEEDTEEDTGVTYTASELAKAIQEKKEDLKDFDMNIRTAELELKRLNTKKENAMVKATINGTVKTVGDPTNPPTDGSPFIEVTGEDGVYVSGEISEMLLNQITAGQAVTVSSWNSGMVFTGAVIDVSPYPSEDGNNYYSEGNPNVSFYPFTAYIDEPEGLSAGEYVQISIASNETEEEMNGIYLEKAYVRKENGKSYVYKVGKDNTLTKQYVTTGKALWGYAIEVKTGLTLEDRIAFPYGKTAKEGVRASTEGEEDLSTPETVEGGLG